MIKTKSLHKQLNTILGFIIVFQSMAIVVALFISNTFGVLSFEAVRTFSNVSIAQTEKLNSNFSQIMAVLSDEANLLNEIVYTYSSNNKVEISEMYLDDNLYNLMLNESKDTLVNVLEKCEVTGAFVILDSSHNDPNNLLAHSAIYFRDAIPDRTVESDLEFLVGPISIAQDMKIATSSNLRVDLIAKEEKKFDFYDNPISAAVLYPNSEILRYGYWSKPFDILNDSVEVITYTLPLIDKYNKPYGVIGVEISKEYLEHNYLSADDKVYENNFYALTDLSDNKINNSWSIPGSSLANAYIGESYPVELKKTDSENLYETKFDGIGKLNFYVSELDMYSDNSPYVDQTWALVSFIEKSVLRSNVYDIRMKMIVSLMITVGVAMVAGFVVSHMFTRRITGLSDYVKWLSPLDEMNFEKTGIQEVDELTSAIAILNQNLIDTNKTTSKILELSLLPIGGYEILNNSQNVKITDYLYKFLHIENGRVIDKDEWETYYNKLTANIYKDHENVFYYFDEYSKREFWLRIKNAQSDTGIVGVILDVSEDIRENIKLSNKIDYDFLTGLYSQTKFKSKVTELINENSDDLGAMLFFDLDNLKYINDTFGHELGDQLIIKASNIFKHFEQFNAITSRISGDEFAIYFYGYKNRDDLRNIINLIKDKSNKYYIETPSGTKNKIRFSGGVAWYPKDATNVSDLLKLADFTMLEAKQKEKGSIYEFNKEYYENMSFLLENREDINKLIDEKQIRFAFQPIVDLNTGEIFAFEALMRPMMPNFNGPYEVLSVAAAQSKLPQLDRVVALTALESVESNEDIISGRHIFINSIPTETIDVSLFKELKDKYSKYFDQVVIEIIERDSRDEEGLVEKVNYLKDMGFKIAIDDFGSGYSNDIRILKLLPDIVKIDMELVQGISKDKDKQSIVTNLVAFCHQKNIKLVAEGIELKEDFEYIMDIGVDYAQGFYLARPNFDFIEIPINIKSEILEYNKKV